MIHCCLYTTNHCTILYFQTPNFKIFVILCFFSVRFNGKFIYQLRTCWNLTIWSFMRFLAPDQKLLLNKSCTIFFGPTDIFYLIGVNERHLVYVLSLNPSFRDVHWWVYPMLLYGGIARMLIVGRKAVVRLPVMLQNSNPCVNSVLHVRSSLQVLWFCTIETFHSSV